MVSVEQLIGDLLVRHNCVIIPAFGGFVAKQTSASIDYKNGIMTPPRKSLLFNRQLINNDGLLIAELAVSNAINYNQATDTVGSLVNTWNEKLRNGERITIDKIGFLFYDQEKNICFEQDRFFNLLLESYGLETVHFLSENDVQLAQKTTIERALSMEENNPVQPAIVFNTEAISTENGTSETRVIEHPALQKNSKIWRYVAAACLLPIAFYSFWLPMKTPVLESGMVSIQDFNLFYKSTDGNYSQEKISLKSPFEKYTTLEESVAALPNDIAIYSYKYSEDLYIPIRLTNALPNAINEELPEVKGESQVSVSTYNLIVGCFGSESNAKNLVSTLKSKGFSSQILDISNGLYRVSIGAANSVDEMQKISQTATAQGFEGWVLKK
jgi:hypothetical protein